MQERPRRPTQERLAAHCVTDGASPGRIEDPDAEPRCANEVHGLTGYANLEEGHLGAGRPGERREANALHVPPIELGLHVSRGAIA
jgi:hypothetical protein